ncbi:MAG TPA: nuclear transport factor 2 family protein [Chitinophagaceae bacterium]|nr:nuclear transport factor 2 family protein [Chitinophagaceae bacterium]
MQKYLSLVLVCIYSSHADAQRSIDSMIQAEEKFANTAMVVSTREAFIKFIDASGIVFDDGKPVNGLELYTKSERRPGVLSWEPEYAEIASTNDFGYTTGPWSYYANSVKEKPVATGYFVTVWHLTQSGWKFLIDFGISCTPENKKKALKKRHAGSLKSPKAIGQSCTDAEQKFIHEYAAQGVGAYASALSSQSRINYAGFRPATNAEQRKALLDSLPRNINYTIIGSGMSPAKDLGYVYGAAVTNDKQDGYLRIWRKEKEGWRIAVEVLHFK